jgi:hypothetical protein
VGKETPPKKVPALADMGVDKNFAHQARKLGRLDQQDFDDLFDDWRNLKPYSSALTRRRRGVMNASNSS